MKKIFGLVAAVMMVCALAAGCHKKTAAKPTTPTPAVAPAGGTGYGGAAYGAPTP